MWQAFPTSEYYGPADFLKTVPTSFAFGLVCRYSLLESFQDLPRLRTDSTTMPCSKTPVASDLILPCWIKSDGGFHCRNGVAHYRFTRISGLVSFNPMAYGLVVSLFTLNLCRHLHRLKTRYSMPWAGFRERTFTSKSVRTSWRTTTHVRPTAQVNQR